MTQWYSMCEVCGFNSHSEDEFFIFRSGNKTKRDVQNTILESCVENGNRRLTERKIKRITFFKNLFLFNIIFLIIILYLTFRTINLFLFYLFFERRLISTLILMITYCQDIYLFKKKTKKTRVPILVIPIKFTCSNSQV